MTIVARSPLTIKVARRLVITNFTFHKSVGYKNHAPNNSGANSKGKLNPTKMMTKKMTSKW